MTTGERMRYRRKEIGLSAEKVAEKLGVSPATIYRYEKGDIEKVPVDSLTDLAKILQVTPAYLMGWDDQPQPSQTVRLPRVGQTACNAPPPEDPITAEILNAVRSMPADQQQQVLQFAQYLADRAQK